MNRRKITKGLDTDDVKNLNWGWHYARKIGLPLNTLVTFRPDPDLGLSQTEYCELFAALRNKIGGYARRHGFRATFAWSREINPDGTGEHLHILVHVPRRHRDHFADTVIRWMSGPAEADVQRAHYDIVLTKDGKRHSAIGYISKQMTTQARWKRGLRWIDGGPILGKRGGVSQNIDWVARTTAFRPPKPYRPAASIQHASRMA